MTTITLIRHAPLASNCEDLFIGTFEESITAEGIAAARQLAQEITFREFDTIYSSPLSRCIETAQHLFPNCEITIDDNLVERHLGEWEGQRKSQLRLQHPSAFLASGKLSPYFTPPGGETIENVIVRASQFLSNVSRAGENAAVVTHNGVIRVIRSLLEGISLEVAFLGSEPYLTPRTLSI